MIPSKTFLLGEYVALQGGPSLVALTKPLFKFTSGTLHPDSPGARFAQKYDLDASFQVVHPHPRKGGFGASTAEFLHLFQRQFPEGTSVRFLLDEYRQCLAASWASGADLIAQNSEQISYWNELTGEQRALDWPFLNLQFSLFQTQQKVATHQHLAELADTSFLHLRLPVQVAYQALEDRDERGFVAAVVEFSSQLQALGLVHQNTREILQQIGQSENVLAGKGCGALGADVIAVFHRPGWGCEIPGLCLVASSADLYRASQAKLSPMEHV